MLKRLESFDQNLDRISLNLKKKWLKFRAVMVTIIFFLQKNMKPNALE